MIIAEMPFLMSFCVGGTDMPELFRERKLPDDVRRRYDADEIAGWLAEKYIELSQEAV